MAGHVRAGQMGENPDDRDVPGRLGGQGRAHHIRPRPRGGAAARHPGVDLQVQAGRTARLPRRRRDLLDQAGRPGGQVHLVAHGLLVGRSRHAHQAQHRRRHARAAQRECLRDGDHPGVRLDCAETIVGRHGLSCLRDCIKQRALSNVGQPNDTGS